MSKRCSCQTRLKTATAGCMDWFLTSGFEMFWGKLESFSSMHKLDQDRAEPCIGILATFSLSWGI